MVKQPKKPSNHLQLRKQKVVALLRQLDLSSLKDITYECILPSRYLKKCTGPFGEILQMGYAPRLQISLEGEHTTSETELLTELNALLLTKSVNVPGTALTTTFTEYMQFVIPLGLHLSKTPSFKGVQESLVKKARQIGMSLLDGFDSLLWPVMNETLIRASSIFAISYHLDLKSFTVVRHLAEEHQIHSCDGPRLGTRLGTPWHDCYRWATIDGNPFGLPGSELPVYIQKPHVMDQMKDRLTLDGMRHENWVYEDFFWKSILFLQLQAQDTPNKYFLAVYLHPSPESRVKVGYFVIEMVKDVVLVKTFLTITMDGTPEGQQLWKRLSLSCYDKEYLGIDVLDNLIRSDLKNDLQLRAIFSDCGLSDLFTLGDIVISDNPPPRIADAARKYLNLSNPTRK